MIGSVNDVENTCMIVNGLYKFKTHEFSVICKNIDLFKQKFAQRL